MTAAAITFEELIADNVASTSKWHTWFTANGAALDVPCDIYNSGTVSGLLKHIFAAEMRHSQRLRGEELIAHDAISAASLDDLFTLHAQAIENLQTFLAAARDSDLNEVVEWGSVSGGTLPASRRKLFAHILLHSIRHWAQLTTILREHGFKTDWQKDFLFSEAIR